RRDCAGRLPPLSLVPAGLAAPQALDAGAMFLGFQPFATLRLGHFRRPSRRGSYRGLPDQREEPVARILAVTLLGPMLLCDDDNNAFLGQALACEAHQPHSDIVRQGG